MLLKLNRPLSASDGRKLMKIYRESNAEMIESFYPDCTDMDEGLKMVEEDFVSFMDEFLGESNNICFVLDEDGEWLSALRLTNLGSFWYLEALETAPTARRKGYGEKLLRAVIEELSDEGTVAIRDCVGKRNIPSLELHKKCGFVIDEPCGTDYINGTISENQYGLLYLKP